MSKQRQQISTQNLLELLMSEMEHIEEYTKLLKETGTILNNHLSRIRNEKVKIDTTPFVQLYNAEKELHKQSSRIPHWLVWVIAFALITGIISSTVLISKYIF